MGTTVWQAITAVMGELPSIGKADRSPEGYQYRGIEAITSRLQPLLAKHGVVIVPRATITHITASPAMKEGWQDIHMRVEWQIHGPDGTVITATTCGIGRDRADKGANKAHTQAYKYLLLSLFAIADRNDDPDAHDTRADIEPAAPRKAARSTGKADSSSSDDQVKARRMLLAQAFDAAGIETADRLPWVRQTLFRPDITGIADLTDDDIALLTDKLKG